MRREICIKIVYDDVAERSHDVGEDVIKQIADTLDCSSVILTNEAIYDDYGCLVYTRACNVDANGTKRPLPRPQDNWDARVFD